MERRSRGVVEASRAVQGCGDVFLPVGAWPARQVAYHAGGSRKTRWHSVGLWAFCDPLHTAPPAKGGKYEPDQPGGMQGRSRIRLTGIGASDDDAPDPSPANRTQSGRCADERRPAEDVS